jgi:outer membrane receptor protein involved in Fe transport
MKKLIWILALLPGYLFAQQGAVSGTCIDIQTAETMISLPVIVVGTDVVRTTDFDGKYSVPLPPGTYTLKFTYLGYQDKIVTDVIVKANEVTYLDVQMEQTVTEMQEIVVTAKAIERTENALLMLQRKSDKIQDGISSQEMSRMAVGNVASAMTKITGTSIQEGKYVVVRGLGDRYSISQLNGLPMPSIDPYRNSAQLDLIPTKLLDNIIATKSFTPDQPGTFTGGNIDIKTKSFPEARTFSISLSMGYNTQNSLQDDFLTYEGGDGDKWGYGMSSRKRPEILSDSLVKTYLNKNAELKARFGDSLAASVVDQVVDQMSFQFQPQEKKSSIDYGLSLSYGNSFAVGKKSSLGLIVGGSYKKEYEHRPQSLQASWFVFDIKSESLMNSGNYRRTESQENPVVNGFGGLAFKFNDYHNIDFKAMYNHNSTKGATYIIGEDGNNILAPSFKVGRSLSWQEREMNNYQLSGDHHFPTLGNLEIEWRGSIVTASREEPNLRFFASQIDTAQGTEGIPLANVNDPFYFWRTLEDDIKVGAVDITLPILNNKNDGSKIKIGGMASMKDRNFDEYRYIVATGPSATKFTGSFDEFFAPGNLGLIRTETQPNGTKRYVIGNYINEATRFENSYAGNEDVAAAYAMLTISPLRNLKFIGGARLETTDIFVQSKIVQIIGEEPDSTNTGSISITNVLPSLNLIYALNDNMNLRGSYTQTLARPNLREIAPFASFDPLIDEFFIGNPELTTTDIQNYDLRWEWFPSPGEMFAISGFYKYFDNPITLQYRNSSNPEFQFANVENGEIGGVELEFRKSLGFIGSAMEHFKLSANVAIIESSMDVVEQSGLEPESRPFEGQSPVLANVILGYVHPEKEWDIQLAYNFTGERLSIIGLVSPDIYERDISMLDLIISKKFGPVSLKLAANNILDPDYTTSSQYKGAEYLTRSYKKGASFNFSIAYEL